MPAEVTRCGGPLTWYIVPPDEALPGRLGEPSGLIECHACGWWSVASGQPDPAHLNAMVALAD